MLDIKSDRHVMGAYLGNARLANSVYVPKNLFCTSKLHRLIKYHVPLPETIVCFVDKEITLEEDEICFFTFIKLRFF